MSYGGTRGVRLSYRNQSDLAGRSIDLNGKKNESVGIQVGLFSVRLSLEKSIRQKRKDVLILIEGERGHTANVNKRQGVRFSWVSHILFHSAYRRHTKDSRASIRG